MTNYSTGIPELDSLLEGVQPGDNVVFQLSDPELYHGLVERMVEWCQLNRRAVLYVRGDGLLDDVFDAVPSAARFECASADASSGDGPNALRRRLRAFLSSQKAGACYAFDGLAQVCRRYPHEEDIRAFYRDTCRYLHELGTVAYWWLEKGQQSPETIAAIRDCAQVFLHIEGPASAPIVRVRKVLGRYSDRMYWSHHLDLETGRLDPILETGPAAVELAGLLEEKVDELRRVRINLELSEVRLKTLAELRYRSMTDAQVPQLLEEAAAAIPHALGASCCEVLEHHPGDDALRYVAGSGWPDETLARAALRGVEDSHAGWALRSPSPVVVEDLSRGVGFREPAHLAGSELTAAMVAISSGGLPFGVLAAYAPVSHVFGSDDVHFLQAVATVLSMAIDQRRDRKALIDSEARTRAILDASLNAIITSDERGVIHSINPAAQRLFGYATSELVGQNVSLLAPSPLSDDHDRFVERYRVTGEKRIIGIGREVRARRKDGSLFPAHLSVADVQIQGGRVFIATVHDLTEQKRLEEQLLQAQKMEAIGRLAGGVAHDFNNLLLIILGRAELLLSRSGADDRAQEEVREIQRAGERGAVLTRQLLAFSRQEALEAQLLDLNVIVENVHTMLTRLIGEDIEISLDLDPAIDSVLGDPGQIEQVLMNLAVNARDAMPTGGRLAISTACADVDDLMLPQAGKVEPRSYVLLSVKDTGVGMDEATQARIFDPYYTTKEEGKGTGLGLSMVYGIVRQCRGLIAVETEPGRGADFRLYFPAADAELPVPELRSDPKGAQRGSETVLVVEDDPGARSLLVEALSENGYVPLSSVSVDEALRIYAEHGGPVDVLVTDLVMPRATGRDLAKELMRENPSLRVVLMTGYVEEAVPPAAELQDRSALLQKPFSLADFLSTIRRLLDSVDRG